MSERPAEPVAPPARPQRGGSDWTSGRRGRVQPYSGGSRFRGCSPGSCGAVCGPQIRGGPTAAVRAPRSRGLPRLRAVLPLVPAQVTPPRAPPSTQERSREVMPLVFDGHPAEVAPRLGPQGDVRAPVRVTWGRGPRPPHSQD
ncbi:hypothetical protein ANANG_G00294590, partial [Anguilla anguilla]